MELGIAVPDPARRDMIVRHAAHELGISEGAAWDYVRRTWAHRAGPKRGAAAPQLQPAARLSAEQLLPVELLGLLLENPDLLPEAADRLDVRQMRDCPATQALERLLRQGKQGARPDLARFVGSLGELAGTAAQAASEERARAERTAVGDAQERFELYIRYLEQKEKRFAALDATGLDDESIRALERRMKELDRRSAESK
jgi:hypothetical protein